jgi:hypothetical protein
MSIKAQSGRWADPIPGRGTSHQWVSNDQMSSAKESRSPFGANLCVLALWPAIDNGQSAGAGYGEALIH